MKRIVCLLVLVSSVVNAQDFPLDKSGNIRYERIYEVKGSQIERAIGWIVEANSVDEIYYLDTDYGKVIFRGNFPTYGVDYKKGQLGYSGNVSYLCTLLMKGDRCKVTLSSFVHVGGIKPLMEERGSLSVKELDRSILTQPDWTAWYRLRNEAEIKINALLDTLEGWLQTDEFDF